MNGQHAPESFSGERQIARASETVAIVDAVSRLAGGEQLPVYEIASAGQVGQDPGMYFLRTTNQMEATVDDANFQLQPTLVSGCADSAHAIVAGNMLVDSGESDNWSLSVATKCFKTRAPEERLERARNEVGVMEDMLERGALTFRPVALIVAPEHGRLNREVVVVTEFDPRIITLDNVPWSRGLTPDNRELALQAVAAVAEFQAMGYYHGDAKIKNVAQHQSGNKMGMIDYETSRPIDPTDPDDVANAAYMDLGMFLASLHHKGLFSEGKVDENTKFLNEITQTFLDVWNEASPEVQHETLQAVGSVLDRNLEMLRGAA
jgi:hypothetical protein